MVADLDVVDMLALHGIERVTEVATSDRFVTQPIAARIFSVSIYAGLAWWSVYRADWSNVMLWAHAGITLVSNPEPLSIDHRAVIEAAIRLPRPIVKR